ncbi:MAG: galactose-1-phosphate uridylyltransferase [Planctomycetaceae bacterium]|nr:MAG: galactose-1-phosphate uridylyltransferase [Planctomycetaceae bacterium]
MSELRKDPIMGRWVVIAPERAQRPGANIEEMDWLHQHFDPFAEGNEFATPPEILAYRQPGTAPNGPGWRVRVVPNKFPALQVEGSLDKKGDGIYDIMRGIGAHEVIIECPHSETNMSRLTVENIREVLWIYKDRLVDLKKDRRLVHALIFKNKGMLAGATLPHSHSQLIATPIVPVTIAEEMQGAQDFYRFRGRCVYEDIIQQELDQQVRIVHDTPHFVAVCPFASRFPFEIWIIPRQHSSHYENIPRGAIDELGDMLKYVLRKLELALDDPSYNYVIHTAPFDISEVPYYRWHMEIFPRLTRVAGFEWGSGFYINPVSPEQAAQFLRKTDIEQP